jgi:hypothetical protein
MKTLKMLMLISVIFFVAGCKLAAIVVEGGEVQSTSSGTCIAGSVCIIEVNDTNFNETFTAVPDPGWYFKKWNSGEGFLCSKSTGPTCVVSSEAAEGLPAFEALIASSATFYMMPIFEEATPIADTIIVNGIRWAQVDLFTNLSWAQINAVCPAGVCAGLLNGHNMTGWTWASVEDINALFNHYIGSDALDSNTGYYSGGGWDSWWANAFRNDGWRGYMLSPEPQVLYLTQGWLRDKYNAQDGSTARLIDVLFDDQGFLSGDSIFTFESSEINQAGASLGGWFYRTP